MGLSLNYSDAIRKIHQSNSTPFKKVNQSNFAIHFAKWEQHEMEQGSGKNKTFPVKITFLNILHIFSAIFVILDDTADICFLFSCCHVACLWTT